MAFGQVCQLRDRCFLASIRDSDEFLILMKKHIEWVIWEQQRNAEAVRRGGQGRAKASWTKDRQEEGAGPSPVTDTGHHRTDVDLDEIASRQPPAEDVVLAELVYGALLERLPDDVHRTILKMRCQRYSIEEIARHLGVVRRTIERKLEEIQKIFRKGNSDS